MFKTLTALAVILATSLPAAARDGNSSLRDFNKERAKAEAAGGYGNPMIAVPTAIFDALEDAGDAMIDTMTSDDEVAKAAK